eukprot:gene5868-6461_t
MNRSIFLPALRSSTWRRYLATKKVVSSSSSSSSSKSSKSTSNVLLPSEEIMTVINAMKTDHRQRENGCLEVKQCNLCSKGNKDKADNLWKLNVRPDGSYYCYRCAIGGGFQDLRQKFSSEEENAQSKKKTYPNQVLTHQYHLNLFPPTTSTSTTTSEELEAAKNYVNTIRGLNDEILRKYLVGYTIQQYLDDEGEWKDHVCITFPIVELAANVDLKHVTFQAVSSSHPQAKKPITLHADNHQNHQQKEVTEGKEKEKGKEKGKDKESVDGGNGGKDFFIQRVKYRAIETKGLQRLLPKGGSWGFFGWHTVYSTNSNAVIITEGEYDCMAVAQALTMIPKSTDIHRKKLKDIPVVSLPNGCQSFPSELIPLLERFQIIYLYLDYDQPGQAAVEKIIRKLGPGRCFIVTPPADMVNPPKDANDALRSKGGNELIVNMLLKAKQLSHQHIETFANLRPSILQIVNDLRNGKNGDKKAVEGSITPSLGALTEIIKGFRRGELIVLSGPTGCGKTTLLSQLSIDFARQGASTLWGSFEVRNTRLVLKMIQQSYRGSHSKALVDLLPEELDKILDDFEILPLQFMNFFGATHIESIIEAMEYTVEKDDVHHFIIDNLQFLMPRIAAKSSFEKYDYQDLIIEKFRKFASEKNVNVILVVHPRKEEDQAFLGLSSIGGSAKASQEADVVLLLQKSAGNMFLDVRKNRYDGALGRIGMNFDSTHCLFQQTTVDTECTNFFSTGVYNNNNDYYSRSNANDAGNSIRKRGKPLPGR